MQQISNKIKSGLAWNFFNQVIGQLIVVAFNIYLSRLLGPEAFGLIGIVTIFSGFATFFIDSGLGAAIVHKTGMDNNQVSTIFWINVIMGLLLYIIFFTLAPVIARIYHQPALVLLTRVLALTFIISGFGVVQNSLLLKHMNFRRKTINNWVSLSLAYTTALIMAALHTGYWAIVSYLLLSSFIYVVLNWVTSKWRPSFHFSMAEFKQVAPFSLSVLGDSSVNYWSRNADNFLIGKYLGTVDLGIYSRAYTIMMLPMKSISTIISGVMFPAFSSIQQNIGLIKHYYLITVKYVALVCFPLMIGLSLTAYDFTYIFFGVKWLVMVNVLRWLCALAAFQSIVSLNGIIYKSLGKAKMGFTVSVFVGVILIIAFITGLYFGRLMGLVTAYFIASVTVMLPVYAIALRLIGCSLVEVAVNLKGPGIGVAVMALMLGLLKHFIVMPVNLPAFCLQVLFCMVVYIACVYLVDKKLITGIKQQFKKKV